MHALEKENKLLVLHWANINYLKSVCPLSFDYKEADGWNCTLKS